MIVGACVLTEEHHDVFHVSVLVIPVLEGGKEGRREGRRGGGREGGEEGRRKGGGKRRKGRGGSEELGGNHKQVITGEINVLTAGSVAVH